jgi:hypothetical protein
MDIRDCGMVDETRTEPIPIFARSGASSWAGRAFTKLLWGALSVLIYIYFTTFNDLFTDPYRILTVSLHRFTQLLRMQPLCAHTTRLPLYGVSPSSIQQAIPSLSLVLRLVWCVLSVHHSLCHSFNPLFCACPVVCDW